MVTRSTSVLGSAARRSHGEDRGHARVRGAGHEEVGINRRIVRRGDQGIEQIEREKQHDGDEFAVPELGEERPTRPDAQPQHIEHQHGPTQRHEAGDFTERGIGLDRAGSSVALTAARTRGRTMRPLAISRASRQAPEQRDRPRPHVANA